MTYREESGDGWTLRLGDYREVLADVECDAVITDPPYSERTHSGHDRGTLDGKSDTSDRRVLSYAHWTVDDVRSFMESWSDRAGWIAAMSSDDLVTAWRGCAEDLGRLGFQSLPCVIPGMTVRLAGDGPSSWAASLNVSRPRREPFSKWGTLRGYYKDTSDRGHIGGKPLGMMRAIVRDYSRPGDLVCDPCAGGGTTLLAAVTEGRRAIGAEIDPATFDLAVARLRKGHTRDLFTGVA